ncbi:response regulator transcription factor [Zavarzinia sp. CC-PAN008]|uniref:response regulator transcription factor n=1 Tax=Zavarzinia sp. CC-PAN008 TaxID=3243332 RepID=UPI003F742115
MGRMVVVVEDDQAVRESLRMLLELDGYMVRDFATGEAMLAAHDLEQSCCVILDVDLPGASGLETLRRLRARAFDRPAIFMTGRPSPALQVEARRLSAQACFAKPVDIDAMLQAIALT